MKITCDRAKLLEAFGLAATAASARSPKPALSCLKLAAGNEATTLTGTDLEIGVRVRVENVQVDTGGEALLPLGTVGAILRESSEEEVTIEGDGGKMLVRGRWSKYQLPTIDPREFPELDNPPADGCFVAAGLLREMIRRTIFSVETESARYALGGVLWEIEPEKLTAVATDGRRLATLFGPARTSAENAAAGNNPIVPARAMQSLERVLTDEDGEVRFVADGNSLWVQGTKVLFFGRLLEGRFPQWRDVLPRTPAKLRVELPVDQWLRSVRQAAVVTDKEHRGVLFNFEAGRLILSSQGPSLGDAQVELPISYEGPGQSVELDPLYVAEFLRVLDAETTVSIELREPESPVLFKAGENYEYVVMPMLRGKA